MHSWLIGVVSGRRCGTGTLRTSETSIGLALALKLKSLGADADDLDNVLQAVRPRVRIAAGGDIVRPGDQASRSTLLLAGMTCGYELGPAVGDDYTAPFPCNIPIHRVVVDVVGEHERDPMAVFQALMAEQ